MKVLVVEDDVVDFKALHRVLRALSISLDLRRAETLGQALEQMTWEPQMVFLDLGLPDSEDPVLEVEAAMPEDCRLVVISGADLGRAWDLARGHEVVRKSHARTELGRAGALMRLLEGLPL